MTRYILILSDGACGGKIFFSNGGFRGADGGQDCRNFLNLFLGERRDRIVFHITAAKPKRFRKEESYGLISALLGVDYIFIFEFNDFPVTDSSTAQSLIEIHRDEIGRW